MHGGRESLSINGGHGSGSCFLYRKRVISQVLFPLKIVKIAFGANICFLLQKNSSLYYCMRMRIRFLPADPNTVFQIKKGLLPEYRAENIMVVVNVIFL
jgi:hypothetical protein